MMKKIHKILGIKAHNDSHIVSLVDGGVISISKDEVNDLIPSQQAKSLVFEYSNISDKEKYLNALRDDNNKLKISNLEFIDNGPYSWHKEYILNNGSVVLVNSIGIIYDEKYYDFEEFLKKHKDDLSEDAFYEFKKYSVKQDTGTGIINPFNLDANSIELNDIIVALSGINRFAGQTKALYSELDNDFYSVGQHSLAMYYAIKNRPNDINIGHMSQDERDLLAKQALLHELYEGVTGTDLISPIKYATKNGDYRVAETEAEIIAEKIFGFALMTDELKKIDRSMAATEGHYLVGQSNTDWAGYSELYNKDILFVDLSKNEVKERMVALFKEEGLYQTLKNYRFAFGESLVDDKIFQAKVLRNNEILGESVHKELIQAINNLKIPKGIEVLSDEEISIEMMTGKRLYIKDGEASVIGKDEEIKINTSGLASGILNDINRGGLLGFNDGKMKIEDKLVVGDGVGVDSLV